jgi:hypothetical protein
VTTRALALKRNQKTADRFFCSRHPEGRLTGVVDGFTPYRCAPCFSAGEDPTLIERLSATQTFKTGGELPIVVEANIANKLGDRKAMMTTTDLAMINPTETQLANIGKEWSADIEGFGKLKHADLVLAAQLSDNGFQRFHFNVLHGKLSLNYDGWLYWTRRSMGGRFGGVEGRAMTAQEREEYELDSKETGAMGCVYEIGGGIRFEASTDFGRAGGKKDSGTRGNPVARENPMEMAIKRAKVRAMRSACPLGVQIAAFETEDFVAPSGLAVDVSTGEVREELRDDISEDAADTYAWPEPDGVQKTTTGMHDPEFAGTMQLIAEAGFDSEKKIEYLSFITGESGGKAVIAAIKGGYRAEQILDALRVQDPKQAQMDLEPESDVDELPW